MGFLGIGTWELLLILILALIIWGPNRLPEIARTLGKVMRTLKKASFDFTSTISREWEEEKDKTPPPQQAGDAAGKTGQTQLTAGDKEDRHPERH